MDDTTNSFWKDLVHKEFRILTLVTLRQRICLCESILVLVASPKENSGTEMPFSEGCASAR